MATFRGKMHGRKFIFSLCTVKGELSGLMEGEITRFYCTYWTFHCVGWPEATRINLPEYRHFVMNTGIVNIWNHQTTSVARNAVCHCWTKFSYLIWDVCENSLIFLVLASPMFNCFTESQASCWCNKSIRGCWNATAPANCCSAGDGHPNTCGRYFICVPFIDFQTEKNKDTWVYPMYAFLFVLRRFLTFEVCSVNDNCCIGFVVNFSSSLCTVRWLYQMH